MTQPLPPPRPLHEYSLDELPTFSARSGRYSIDDARHLYAEAAVHYASIREKKRLWWKNAVINCLFIGSWFFFATILSVYNKWMFSDKYFNFQFPLFVTSLHMFVQFFAAAFVRAVWPHWFRPPKNPSLADYGKKAAPTAIATSLDIGLSNLSLRTISLSFYTMVKSSSLIFVLTFAFLFRLEIFSWRLIGVIFLICAGVLLMVATETHFVLAGFLMVLSASALGGLRWALTQILLKNKKMGLDNPAATVFWLSPLMGITLLIIGSLVENWRSLPHSEFFATTAKGVKTVGLLTAPGLVAFCMVLSEFSIIQRAGIVPMSIAGIAKEVTTITIAAWFFGDELTPLNITGVAITIGGISLFTYHKYRKSLETSVPLDAHGNPIAADDLNDLSTGPDGYQDETRRLTAPRLSEELSHEDNTSSNTTDPQILFEVQDDQDDDNASRTIPATNNTKLQNGSVDHGPPPRNLDR